MTTSNLKFFFIYFTLTFFTLSAPIGHFLHSSDLLKIGLAGLASPLMIVYSELSGERVMSFKYELTLTDEDNKTKKITLDKHLYNEIASHENYFNRHILILPYMAGTFLLTGEGKNTLLREKALRYGICDKGPYTKYLGLDTPIKQVKIIIYKDETKKSIFNEYNLIC